MCAAPTRHELRGGPTQPIQRTGHLTAAERILQHLKKMNDSRLVYTEYAETSLTDSLMPFKVSRRICLSARRCSDLIVFQEAIPCSLIYGEAEYTRSKPLNSLATPNPTGHRNPGKSDQ